jgi:hypothetical protein
MLARVDIKYKKKHKHYHKSNFILLPIFVRNLNEFAILRLFQVWIFDFHRTCRTVSFHISNSNGKSLLKFIVFVIAFVNRLSYVCFQCFLFSFFTLATSSCQLVLSWFPREKLRYRIAYELYILQHKIWNPPSSMLVAFNFCQSTKMWNVTQQTVNICSTNCYRCCFWNQYLKGDCNLKFLINLERVSKFLLLVFNTLKCDALSHQK